MLKLALLLLSLSTPAALAEDSGACKDDVKKLCSDIEPGGGRIIACLKAHENTLSDGCKAQMKEGKKKLRSAMKEIHQACKADAEKLCPGVEPGEGRIMRCMREHEGELSAGCKETGMKMREERKERRKERRKNRRDGKSSEESHEGGDEAGENSAE